MALRINAELRCSIVNAGIVGTMGTCAIDVFGGTQPATGGGATTQAILVTIVGVVWGSAATAGTVALVASATGTAATNGTATWARCYDTSGSSFIIDGACGTSALGEFIIDDEVIVAGDVFTLTSADIAMPAA